MKIIERSLAVTLAAFAVSACENPVVPPRDELPISTERTQRSDSSNSIPTSPIGYIGAPTGTPTPLAKTVDYCVADPLIPAGTTVFTDGSTGWTEECARKITAIPATKKRESTPANRKDRNPRDPKVEDAAPANNKEDNEHLLPRPRPQEKDPAPVVDPAPAPAPVVDPAPAPAPVVDPAPAPVPEDTPVPEAAPAPALPEIAIPEVEPSEPEVAPSVPPSPHAPEEPKKATT